MRGSSDPAKAPTEGLQCRKETCGRKKRRGQETHAERAGFLFSSPGVYAWGSDCNIVPLFLSTPFRGRVFRIDGMVEKPKPGSEPSNLTILGRYILQPEIFGLLSAQEKGAGGEIQITDAMIALLKRQPFYALKYEGKTFDCGSKIGFLTANVAYALARPDLADAFKAEIKKLI